MDSMVCYWDSKGVKCDHFAGHGYLFIIIYFLEVVLVKLWLINEFVLVLLMMQQ